MKVLAISTWFPTSKSPHSGAFVVKDLHAIAAAGNKVHLLHLVPPQQDDGVRSLKYQGIPVRRIPMGTNRPDQILAARQQMRRYLVGHDIVHTMAVSSLLPFAPRRPEQPWVHTEHWSGLTNPDTLPKSWQALLPLITQLERRPDVVTAVVEYLAAPIRAVRKNYPTEVIPCIVPTPDPVVERPAAGERLRLVSTGGLVERKDPLLAVEIVALLNQRGRPTQLTWVGEGPLRAEVEAAVNARGLQELIHLPGSKPPAEVFAELARADLFLGPTRGDNFFVSCAEAIVAGRPVVVGAAGGQSEYIDPQVGALVAEQEASAYAAAIEAVLERAGALRAADISATIGTRFAAETVGNSYHQIYERLLAGEYDTVNEEDEER